MKCWQHAQLRLITSAASAGETFKVVLSEVNRLGFQYCSFGVKAPVPLVSPPVIWCSNYPEEWQRRYEEQGYLRCDPTVAHAILSDEAIVWSDHLFRNAPALRAEARSFGLTHGWAQPRRDARGIVSLLTCARNDPEIGAAELSAKSERLQWISYLCHERMLKLWTSELHVGSDLSDRELEVLRWASDGKTSTDVAQILNLSEATVNFHMRNACTKLGTPNRTAATVRAALLGLLS